MSEVAPGKALVRKNLATCSYSYGSKTCNSEQHFADEVSGEAPKKEIQTLADSYR